MARQCFVRYSSAFLVLIWFAVRADANGLLTAYYIKDQAKLAAVNGAMATMREAYEILSNPAIPSFIKVDLHSVQTERHYVRSLCHVRFSHANFE